MNRLEVLSSFLNWDEYRRVGGRLSGCGSLSTLVETSVSWEEIGECLRMLQRVFSLYVRRNPLAAREVGRRSPLEFLLSQLHKG